MQWLGISIKILHNLSRLLKKAHLLRWPLRCGAHVLWVYALLLTLRPPRIWTFLSNLRFILFPQPARSRKLFFVFLFLTACSLHRPLSTSLPSQLERPSPDLTLDSLIQGLTYIRENPPFVEEEQVGRYLWLDRWVIILKSKDQLTPELGQELWENFVTLLTQTPVSFSNLTTLEKQSVSWLGKNIVLYQIYQSYLNEQEIEKSLTILENIQEDGISDIYKRAQELLKLNHIEKAEGTRKIGVLLPLSGKNRSFGEEVIPSIQLVSDFKHIHGLEFHVEDVGTSEASLSDAWQRLMEANVMAVMGPLTPKESELIFEKAEIAALPVISLAPRENLKGLDGSFTFRSTLMISDQLETLSAFLKNNLETTKMAMLLPDSTYGWDVLEKAKEKFVNQNMEVVALRLYPSDTTDFKNPLRQMVRLDFQKLRKDEVCPKEPPPLTESFETKEEPKKCVKDMDHLMPLVDFEVLFVADFANTIGFLLPTLPYLRIYGVQVVGLSGLHSPKLIERGRESAEGVILTDGFFEESQDFQTRFFMERYEKLAKRKPSRLAAEAFDVAMMLAHVMNTMNQSLQRKKFIDTLKEIQNFPGVTGQISYADHEFHKEPKLITVRNGKFRELR